MTNFDKYLAVTMRSGNRYRKNGILVLDRGGIPSKYTVIERLAYNKYIKRKKG